RVPRERARLLGAIVFVHGVTSATAVRSILPYLPDATARDATRYAWQAGCALYSAFGTSPAPAGELEPPRESRDTLIDMAIANGDEHAIKFTESCLREHALNPSPAYLAATRHALGVLAAHRSRAGLARDVSAIVVTWNTKTPSPERLSGAPRTAVVPPRRGP